MLFNKVLLVKPTDLYSLFTVQLITCDSGSGEDDETTTESGAAAMFTMATGVLSVTLAILQRLAH